MKWVALFVPDRSPTDQMTAVRHRETGKETWSFRPTAPRESLLQLAAWLSPAVTLVVHDADHTVGSLNQAYAAIGKPGWYGPVLDIQVLARHAELHGTSIRTLGAELGLLVAVNPGSAGTAAAIWRLAERLLDGDTRTATSGHGPHRSHGSGGLNG